MGIKLKKFLVKTSEHLNSFVDYVCMIKTEEEISYIKEACLIADDIYTAVSSEIKPGKTELEIVELFDDYVKRSNASKVSFDTIVGSGPNGAFPHAEPSDRVIAEEDMIVIDFGVVYKGFCSDMTRTLLMNPKDKKANSIYKIVYDAQMLAMEQVKPGVEIKSLDKIARDYIGKYGFEDYFVHGLGHGLGYKVHEKPFVNKKGKGKLKPGMVITIEPGIYLPGYGGVRIEDSLVVTASGYEVLTSSPKVKYWQYL